jgi:hypothetical protein
MAGFAAVVLTMAVVVAQESSPAPAASEVAAATHLDDYGIRCREVGWCSMPLGLARPETYDVTAGDVGPATEVAVASRLDDYGLRCLEVGWCSRPQPSRGATIR